MAGFLVARLLFGIGYAAFAFAFMEDDLAGEKLRLRVEAVTVRIRGDVERLRWCFEASGGRCVWVVGDGVG